MENIDNTKKIVDSPERNSIVPIIVLVLTIFQIIGFIFSIGNAILLGFNQDNGEILTVVMYFLIVAIPPFLFLKHRGKLKFNFLISAISFVIIVLLVISLIQRINQGNS